MSPPTLPDLTVPRSPSAWRRLIRTRARRLSARQGREVRLAMLDQIERIAAAAKADHSRGRDG